MLEPSRKASSSLLFPSLLALALPFSLFSPLLSGTVNRGLAVGTAEQAGDERKSLGSLQAGLASAWVEEPHEILFGAQL